MSSDGTAPGESFYPRIKRLLESYSVLGWNNSRGVILFWDGTTPGESFCPNGTTPGEPFYPRIEQLQWSHSVLGWNDSRGVILYWGERLLGRHSVLVKRLQGIPSVLG